jgi:6-methylsalicylate decarboxylase
MEMEVTHSDSCTRRVDVHAHFIPDFYRTALIEAGHARPDGMPMIPDWDPTAALAFMDELSIATSLLSISSPGVHFGDDAAACELARRVNEEGAKLRRDYPGRFGFLASLPLPNVDAAIIEAVHALDVLSADGVVLETNAHGCYLGDPSLASLWTVLATRRTSVLIHPTSPVCSCIDRHPRPMLEFLFDTTRSVADLVLAGVPHQYPEISFIVPHAGAALPILANRVDAFAALSRGSSTQQAMSEALGQFHFDLAGMPVPHLLLALLAVADPHRLHYGSDYPFTPNDVCRRLADQLEVTPLLSEDLRRGMWRDNALELFPMLSEHTY